MENNQEDTTPQNPVEEVEVKEEEVVVTEPEKVEITQAELEELKKNAEVSSQNFERAKKAESRVKELELTDNEIPSDYEGEDVSQLREEMSAIKAELGQAKMVSKYPQLKDTWDDFEKYYADDENKGMKLETAVKSFLVDKELLGDDKRKGLEKSTGGNKTPQSPGMSVEDVENLRKNDGKKYRDMLKKDQLKFKKA